MNEGAETVLRWLLSIPEWLLYPIAGFAAAIENIVPPFPGDLVVVIVSVITGAAGAKPIGIFLVVWLSNVCSAMWVYALGRRLGPDFFARRPGRFLLAPSQFDGLSRAYRRFGIPIIFFSRFLPIFRPIVPVFAGVAGVGFLATAIPIVLASGIWYGLLVYLGTAAGANLSTVLDTLDRVGGWMWIGAGALAVALAWWWTHTRRTDPGTRPGPNPRTGGDPKEAGGDGPDA